MQSKIWINLRTIVIFILVGLLLLFIFSISKTKDDVSFINQQEGQVFLRSTDEHQLPEHNGDISPIIKVAILDSGINEHDDFKAVVKRNII